MKKLALITLALLAASLVGGVVLGGDAEQVTLEGKILCAKCVLHEEGREKCQNVLAVESDGETQYYYLAHGEANDELGYVCTGAKAARVTGSVTEEDGRLWLAATEIVATDTES